MASGTVDSINVSPTGGVPKRAVLFTRIGTGGVEGDKQNNLKYHGGPMRAVCLYSMERIAALRDEGHPITPGSIGENVTVSGLDWNTIVPGVRLTLGDTIELEITEYTVPCANIRHSFVRGDSLRVGQKRNPGWSRVYAKVLREGTVRVGDTVTLAPAVATAV
ncbi:MAG TPA: MOSC domain-containing protein [Tepidisphaeraceae bacterium]